MKLAITKEACCGCGACAQICPHHCIEMKEDEMGFLYPAIDESHCVQCGLCEKVCPYLNRYEALQEKPASFACRTNDEELCAVSSSGGMFTMLANHVIDQGGVVFGARFAEDWSVIHDYTETKDGLAAFRGSKYVQSVIGDNYRKVRDFLRDGRLVMFSGTPCQVAGLNHFLIKKFENLITMDFVCHCVPSPKVWQSYLKELNAGNRVSYVSFRDKSEGWSSYGIFIKNSETRPTAQGQVTEKTLAKGNHLENVYMKAFLSNLIVRPGCTNCPAHNYTSGADITVADCWGFDKYHPELFDNKGMSLALLHTEKGKAIFEALQPKLFSLSIPYEEVEEDSLHSPITKSEDYHLYYDCFLRDFKKGRYESVTTLMDKYLKKAEAKNNREKRIRQVIRSLVGEKLIKMYKGIRKV